jgi:hypothetical protein
MYHAELWQVSICLVAVEALKIPQPLCELLQCRCGRRLGSQLLRRAFQLLEYFYPRLLYFAANPAINLAQAAVALEAPCSLVLLLSFLHCELGGDVLRRDLLAGRDVTCGAQEEKVAHERADAVR